MPTLNPAVRFWRWWRATRTPMRQAFRRPWPSTLRGLVLAQFSIAFLWLGGVNYIATDLPPTSQASLSFALSIAPAGVWGWAMIGCGALALYTSYCHLGRDRLGYVVLSTFCAAWGLGYLCGFLFFDAGLRAVGGSVIWLLFSGILTTCAAIPTITLSGSGEITPICHPPAGDDG